MVTPPPHTPGAAFFSPRESYFDPRYGDGANGAVQFRYGAYPNSPFSLLASGTASGINRNSGWVDVFWAPVAITSGAQYYLLISSTNPIVASYSDLAYADGNAVFAGSTTTWAGYDLTFRTYADDAIAQVPEPGSLGLLAIGIAGLGGALRKKASSKRAAQYPSTSSRRSKRGAANGRLAS